MAVVTAVRGPTRDYFRPIHRSSTDKIIPFEIPYLLLMELRVKLNPFHNSSNYKTLYQSL